MTTIKIVVAWALVAIPLLYGLVVTMSRVATLFTS